MQDVFTVTEEHRDVILERAPSSTKSIESDRLHKAGEFGHCNSPGDDVAPFCEESGTSGERALLSEDSEMQATPADSGQSVGDDAGRSTLCSFALPGTVFAEMSYQRMASYIYDRGVFVNQLMLMPSSSGRARSPTDAAAQMIEQNLCEYSWSTCFDPEFVCKLTYEGFLCIACELTGTSHCPLFILMPKLHHQRCLVDLGSRKLHISRSTRKQAKKYWISFNREFNKVMRGCVRQHGENWLYLPLRNGLRVLHSRYRKDSQEGQEAGWGGDDMGPRAMSVELWRGERDEDVGNPSTSELVAGELGMTYGAVYLSLTGYYDHTVSGAGSVQLSALGVALYLAGIKIWDMGQGAGTEYKYDFGAIDMPREQFLQTQRAHRDPPLRLQKVPEDERVSELIARYQALVKTEASISAPELRTKKVSGPVESSPAKLSAPSPPNLAASSEGTTSKELKRRASG